MSIRTAPCMRLANTAEASPRHHSETNPNTPPKIAADDAPAAPGFDCASTHDLASGLVDVPHLHSHTRPEDLAVHYAHGLPADAAAASNGAVEANETVDAVEMPKVGGAIMTDEQNVSVVPVEPVEAGLSVDRNN